MAPMLLTAFASASLQVLIEKLTNLGITVINSISNVDDKLRTLERTLFRAQALLHDAEDMLRTDKAWQVSMRDLEVLAYDADDLIDRITIDLKTLDREPQNEDYSDKLRRLLAPLFERTSAFSINNIQFKLDVILKEMDSLCSRQMVQGRHLSMIEEKLQSSSLLDESHVPIRKNDTDEILKMLLSEEGVLPNDLSIIPIVGMVGVGKTTLAQVVYNYSYHNIQRSFTLKMWVSVTIDFNVVKLTRSILEAATGKSVANSDLDGLQVQLRNALRGKKFLLVVDDFWNENQNEWDLLLKPLRHGSNGSKIIVTTRSQIVSSMVGVAGVYHLNPLSNMDCWLVLKQNALGNGNLLSLEAIGMEIAIKCQGLPLAAKTIGSLLRSKLDEDDWKAVLKSNIWDLPEVKKEIIPPLRLSYHHLPSHLKQCFEYCSMFPQSYDFEKDKIVQMWMGEGFIQQDGNRRLEDVGNDYFRHLLLTSFFLKDGDKYKMHDAIHDLARSISGDKLFRVQLKGRGNLNTLGIHRNTRRSSLHCQGNGTQTITLEDFNHCKGLRTFLIYGTCNQVLSLPLFHQLGLLRVLDLSTTQIEDLTASLGKLKHLRFLDLSKTPLKALPETTEGLCSLQTLRLKYCSSLNRLPLRIDMLQSLIHIELGGNNGLHYMPSGIGKLTSLQTLNEFIVGQAHGQIGVLKDMNMLRGQLCIKKLENVKDPQEAEDADLMKKEYLNRLDLQWTHGVSNQTQREEYVLTKLLPNENLKELTFTCYGGTKFPTWMSDPKLLPKLTSISLFMCESCSLLPTLGELPKLKSIKITKMKNVVNVDSSFCGNTPPAFQSLERLELCDMGSLNSWCGFRDNDMKCLQELSIVNCPLLTSIPSLHHLEFLQKLKLENCPQLESFSEGILSHTVQSLIITDCLILTERCREEAIDWMKIEHIKEKEIV